MKIISRFILIALLLPLVSMAQYTNVMITDQNNPCEPSIFVDPSNTNRIIAGTIIDRYAYSDDGGYTWTQGRLTSSHGVWGDPCLLVDTAGDLYYLHLSNPAVGNWIDRIVCQKSSDNGQTWSDGSYTFLNGTKAQDKQWGVFNRADNSLHVTWTQFDDYGTSNPADSSLILYARSDDTGLSWNPAIRLSQRAGDCVDSDNTVEGAVPAIGPNNEVYVSWVGPLGLMFDRSLDGGNTWMQNDLQLLDIPGGWDFNIPGINRCNGFPITVCDLSGGPNHGTIYISWADQRNGSSDTDIWLIKSTDGGNTWSDMKRVNDDEPGKQQFFHWMAIDQVTGHLWFVFYDRRNYTNNQTDVYCAVSKDAGETYRNFRISESPFIPTSSIFFGDYSCISVHDNVVRPIWTRLHSNKLSVWTAIIDGLTVGQTDIVDEMSPRLEQNYPNPFTSKSAFSFKLHKPARVSLIIYDLFGREVARLIDNQYMTELRNVIEYDNASYGLKPGVYYQGLISNEKMMKRKIVIAE
jgi:hypothetical protein